MRKIHIAFINLPTPSNVNPTFPVVSVMVRRGYRVTYVTSDRFAAQVSNLGAEVVRCSAFKFFEEIEGHKGDSRPAMVVYAEKMLAEITEFYENSRPDLIIYDYMAFSGRILAQRWNIRAIQTSPDLPEDVRNEGRLVKNFAGTGVAEYAAQVDDYFKQHGIVDHRVPFYDRLNIFFVPRIFQPPGEDVFGPRFFYAGRCAGEQDPYGDWQCDDSDERPIVLLGTSTTYIEGADYFGMCTRALHGLGCRMVIHAGDKLDAASLRSLPSDCEVVRATTLVRLFRDARLLICHGGLITPAESAYYGVPLLMTTQGFPELEMWADIVAASGLGIHLKKRDTNPESIRRSAQRLMTDPSVLDRVRQIQRRIRQEPGAEETVNQIEEYLEA